MKILHITQYFHPERGYQENQIAKLQANDGHEVQIITSNELDFWGVKKEEIRIKDAVYISSNNVAITRLEVKRKISSRLWLNNFIVAIENFDPDLMILHSIPIPTTIKALKWGVKNNKKVIVDCHMVEAGSTHKRTSRYLYQFFKLWFPLFLKTNNLKVHKWIGVSEETIGFMKSNYGIKDVIKLVPLGFDGEHVYKDIKGGQQWMDTNGIPSDKKIILYIGKLNFEKDPIQLLEAFKLIHKEREDYILLFVGDYNQIYKEQMVILINNLKLNHKIFLLNSVQNQDIRKVFSISSVAVWPHASSMAMLEAMACECPVVASKMLVNEERLGDGRGGLFIENDISDMVKCIDSTLFESEQIKIRAKEWVNKYSWEKLYKEFYI